MSSENRTSGSANELWAQVSPYLDEALGLDPLRREAWLAALEAAHPAVAAELRELLALHAANRASGFMERSALEPALAGERIGAYTIEHLLGRGGMGSVWLGRRSDGKFEGLAAVKLLDRRGLGRDSDQIRHEASLLARLSHPHIARLFDAGVRENGQPYLVLEYVEGEPLDRYCDSHALPLPARLHLFLGVLEAVAHAHAQLIVHRDLKPSNVLVTADATVKLLDFGVASLQPGQGGAATGGSQALTPGYAAPEQLRGEPVSAASDVYALGVLLHVLVTGVHPYGAATPTRTELVRATLTEDPPPASQRLAQGAARRRVRGDLDAIIARALAREPESRYATAAELAAEVRRFLGDFPVRARPATRAYVAGKFAQRHWGGVLSVMLVVLVLAASTVVTTLQTIEARRQRDFARAQLGRAEAINDFNSYILLSAGSAGAPMTVRSLLERALHVLERQHVNDANRVVLLAEVGWQFEAEGDHKSGVRILQEAYGLSRGVSEPSARSRAACSLANALANESPTPRSGELIEEGLRELPARPEFALARSFCLSRGKQVAADLGDGALALQRARAAVAALKEVPFPHDEADMLAAEELASALDNAGRYRESIAAFASGWPLLVALGRDDTVGASTWLNNWAVALIRLGRPLDAEKLLRRTLELRRAGAAAESPSPLTLSNYALVLIDLARPQEATDYAERALREASEAANPIAISQARLRLARIYRAQHRLGEASGMLDGAELSMQKLLPPGHFAFGAVAAERALIAQTAGDLPGALKAINQALAIDEAASGHGKAGAELLPVLWTYRAGIEFDAGRLAAAENDSRQALSRLLADAQSDDYSGSVGRAQLMLARVLRAQGHAEQSRAAARLAAEQLGRALGADHPETVQARGLALQVGS